MKKVKVIIFTLFIGVSFSLQAQTVNEHFFPKTNWIDSSFQKEIQKCINNDEFRNIADKYIELWKQ